MSNPKQEDHNQGQKDGSEATMFDEFVENFNPLRSEEYRAGFQHGREQQVNSNPEEENDEDS